MHHITWCTLLVVSVSVTRGTLDVDCWEGHGKKPLTPTSTTTTPTTTTPTWIDCGVDTYFGTVAHLKCTLGDSLDMESRNRLMS